MNKAKKTRKAQTVERDLNYQDDDFDDVIFHGVQVFEYPRKVLFTQEVEINTKQLKRWKPDIILEHFFLEPLQETLRECELDGKKLVFDYCVKGDLGQAIKFYNNDVYMGSGRWAWYNGILTEFKEIHHFFYQKAA